MITRFPGLTPTRSRAVATDDLVFTVAVAPDPVPPSVYQQAVKVLARIDESLALCGTDKSAFSPPRSIWPTSRRKPSSTAPGTNGSTRATRRCAPASASRSSRRTWWKS